MILFKFLKLDYYTQNTTSYVRDIVLYYNEKKILINSDFLVKQFNKEALYNYSNNTINIPKSFYKSDKNYLQFEKIKKHLGNKTLEFIIKHEFGHLNHHQFLSIQHNINSEQFEYSSLNSNANYIIILGNNSALFFSVSFLLSLTPDNLDKSSFLITKPQTNKSPLNTPAALFSFFDLSINIVQNFNLICFRMFI